MFTTDSKGRLVADRSNSRTKKIIIPDGTVEIGAEAFKGLKITEVVIPESVKRIYKSAFEDCSNLKKITIKEGDTPLAIDMKAFKGTGITEINFPSRVWYIGKFSFSECTQLKTLSGGMGLKTIYSLCFKDSGLEEVDFFEFAPLIQEIGEYAFENNNIQKVRLPFLYQELAFSNTAFANNQVKELISNASITNIKEYKSYKGFEKAKVLN